jgi:4'-phosphopantetheinyl transferase
MIFVPPVQVILIMSRAGKCNGRIISNMIYLLYHNEEDTWAPEKFRELVEQLPVLLQEKNGRFRFSQEAHNHVSGLLLLKKGLELMGPCAWSLSDLQYTVHQRPFFEGGPDFNIAHSGSVTVCAISGEWRVGIDVEKIRDISVDVYRNQFTDQEWISIIQDATPFRNFFRRWTEKEAIVKAIGIGLGVPLREINPFQNLFTLGVASWHTKEVLLHPGYSMHVCSNDPEVELEVRAIRF